MKCEFWPLAITKEHWPKCSYGVDRHHWWNKSKWPRNKKMRARVKKLVEDTYAHIFMVRACPVHNRERWADTEDARRFIFQNRWAEKRKRDEIKQALDELQACYKIPQPELSLERLLL